jgi:putative ABC transport system permease protein
MVLKYGIATFDRKIIIECVLGAISTFLFFASLSGFLLRMIQANKRVYFKGLNMFIVRQINNRINTAYISMSFICLMLFVTIGIFSTGIGMTNVLNKGYEDAAPFDISVQETGDADINALLEKSGIALTEFTDRAYQYHLYEYQKQELDLGTVFQKVEDMFPAEDLDQIKEKVYPYPLYMITESDLNNTLALQNKTGVSLSGNQVALLTQFAWADADYQAYLESPD